MKWQFWVVLAIVIGAVIWLYEPVEKAQTIAQVQKEGTPAPELTGIAGYINAQNVSLSDFVGKNVVLVDFWTYSCINCQRTLPHLTMWDEKYRDKGLKIISIHAPEFEFEKKYDNVVRAVEKWNIQYPVVLDNDHKTWAAFKNRYWPRKYLIDKDGYIVWDHIGEGGYEEAEKMIQKLLGLDMHIQQELPVVEFGRIGTPEIYLGYEFTRGNFGNTQGLKAGIQNYTMPAQRVPNAVYLEGSWRVDTDSVELLSNEGEVSLIYDAKQVNIVAAGPAQGTATIDGKTKDITFLEEDLYTLDTSEYGVHELNLSVSGNFRLYTFTFG